MSWLIQPLGRLLARANRGGSDLDDCQRVSGALVAEALNTATGAEVRAVQKHTARCAACAHELLDLREGAALLALSAPNADPPTHVRRSILRLTAVGSRELVVAGSSDPALALSPSPLRLKPVWGALAATIAISVGSVLWAATMQQQMVASGSQVVQDKADRYDRVVGVLASQQLAIRPLASAIDSRQPQGTVYMDTRSHTGMVMVHNLPPITSERAWQLWFLRGAQYMSGGMVRTDPSGNGYSMIRVPTDVESYDAIGVSEEPVSGSDAPTSPHVLLTNL